MDMEMEMDMDMDMNLDMGLDAVPDPALQEARIVLNVIREDMPNVYAEDRAPASVDVHDHAIQESVKLSIGKLRGWFSSLPPAKVLRSEQVLDQIKEYLFGEYQESHKNKEKTYSTLRTIERVNGTLSAADITELEVLSMVWHRIIDPVNHDVQRELKDNLLELLADSSIKVDNPYCLVGRITRMIQSLQSLDREDIVNIRSTDILAKELQNKIPMLRDEFFQQPGGEELRVQYEEGTDNVAAELQSYVRQKILSDYPSLDYKARQIVEEYICELA